jgi:transcription initiation factor IIE alpha subunit
MRCSEHIAMGKDTKRLMRALMKRGESYDDFLCRLVEMESKERIQNLPLFINKPNLSPSPIG